MLLFFVLGSGLELNQTINPSSDFSDDLLLIQGQYIRKCKEMFFKSVQES